MPDDHSKLVPLLPIPNRTVKRLCADDSADSRVKVGHRQALIAPRTSPVNFTVDWAFSLRAGNWHGLRYGLGRGLGDSTIYNAVINSFGNSCRNQFCTKLVQPNVKRNTCKKSASDLLKVQRRLCPLRKINNRLLLNF